jgi:hypothetical protein
MAGKQAYAPPEVQPNLFTIPKVYLAIETLANTNTLHSNNALCAPQDQEAAPNLSAPESRGDLEALSRLAIEQFSAAFGKNSRHNSML